MKRFLAVLMSTAMVLSLAACSQETAKTPEEIYDEALVKSMSCLLYTSPSPRDS